MKKEYNIIQQHLDFANKAIKAQEGDEKKYLAAILYLDGLKTGLHAAGYIIVDNKVVGRINYDGTEEWAK